MQGTSSLIAYFSRRGENYVAGKIVDLPLGNTEVAATFIQELTGGRLFRIEPVKAYPAGYDETTEVAKQELRQNARPPLKGEPGSLIDCEVVLLGFPNWWDTMPMAVFTFLEAHDFSGKTILPFCTHEGSGMGRCAKDIQRLCPGATVAKGLSLRGSGVRDSKPALANWLRESGLID